MRRFAGQTPDKPGRAVANNLVVQRMVINSIDANGRQWVTFTTTEEQPDILGNYHNDEYLYQFVGQTPWGYKYVRTIKAQPIQPPIKKSRFVPDAIPPAPTKKEPAK